MNDRVVLGCALSLVMLGACSTYRNVPAGEVSAAQVGESGRWSAALSPAPELAGAVAITGWAAMVRDSGGLGTLVTLSLANAPAGALERWSVNRGRCGADQGVFGAADAYQPVRIDGSGRGTAAARVGLKMPAAGEYYVSVRAPAASGEVTVACGDLTQPTP